MKASRLLFLLMLLGGVLFSDNLSAQRYARGGPRKAAAKRKATKVHAHRVIRRTASVILIAQQKVKDGKVYTGNLARAIAHQRYARKLYFQGDYIRAMHQSRRARELAILAIQANNGQETADMAYDPEDTAVMNDNPVSDADLDKELDQNMPGYSTKDQDFVDAAIAEIDLGDME